MSPYSSSAVKKSNKKIKFNENSTLISNDHTQLLGQFIGVETHFPERRIGSDVNQVFGRISAVVIQDFV